MKYSKKDIVPDDRLYVYKSEDEEFKKIHLLTALKQIDQGLKLKYFRVENRELLPVAAIHPHTRVTKTGKTQKVRGHWRRIPEKIEELPEDIDLEEEDDKMDEIENYTDIIEEFRKKYEKNISKEKADPPERGEYEYEDELDEEEIKEEIDEYEYESREESEEIIEKPPEPPEDFRCTAWYVGFHYNDEWGIWARLEAIKDLAKNALSYIYNDHDFEGAENSFTSKKAFRKVLGKMVFNEMMGSIIRHEMFHHMVEVTATNYEIISGKKVYLPYKHRVYEPTFNTENNVEEAMASANSVLPFTSREFIINYSNNDKHLPEQYRRILTVKFVEDVDRYIRKNWLDNAPYSYRKYVKYYKTWKDFMKGIKELNSQILTADVNTKEKDSIEMTSGQLFGSPEIVFVRGGIFSDVMYRHIDFFSLVRDQKNLKDKFPIPLHFV